MDRPGYGPEPGLTRRRVLGHGVVVLPAVGVVVLLRVACLLGWPVAAAWVLIRARAPRWWRSLAGRTVTRAARLRAYVWFLTPVPPRAADHPVAVGVGADDALPRRSLGARLALLPLYALGRWVIGGFAVTAVLIATVTRVTVGRHPARLANAQYRLQALCGDIDAYLLLLVPARPPLPEVDPRLAAGTPALVDHPPLPPWSRRTGRLAIGADLVAGVVVVGFVAGVLAGFGVDLDEDLAAILALDLLIQTLAPLMGFYLAASEAPLTVAQLGLHVLRPVRSLGLAAGLIGSYAVLLVTLGALAIPFAADTSGGGIVPDDTGLAWTLVFLALATVIAPVFEETFYRGVMFQALRDGRGTWVAAVVSSVAFAVAHLEFDPIALIDRSLIGVGLCYLFARTGRLLPGMFAHSMNNAVVAPLALGWTWQVPLVVAGSLLGVLALAGAAGRLTGAWDPVGRRRPTGPGPDPAPVTPPPIAPLRRAPPARDRLWSDGWDD